MSDRSEELGRREWFGHQGEACGGEPNVECRWSIPALFQSTSAVRSGPAKYAPGRPDVIRTIDSVTAGYLALSADGRFWDWPGYTEVYIADKR